MSKLVISEKSSSARRIATILSNGKSKRQSIERVSSYHFERDGEDYSVIGLRGHIVGMDYPEELNSWAEINPKDLVRAKPEKKIIMKSIASALKTLAKDKDEVIVATDYDREGELIGVEALDIVKEVAPKAEFKRARFSALTKVDVERAFDELTEIDYALAESAETRQVIDLAWGATLTRFISLASSRLGREFLSVGRVQSPTLALIVDREKEIEHFEAKPFWDIRATFEKDIEFTGRHSHGRFWNKVDAETVLKAADGAKTGKVRLYEAKEAPEWPPVPFNTTIFLMEANRLGFSASRAMSIAETLYTSGWISYPRTDNTVYPPTLGLKFLLEKLLASAFSKEAKELLKQEKIVPTRGKSFATDHPPIHPVRGAKKSKITGDKWTIYELVCRRFLATVAPPALVKTSKAEIDVKKEVFVCEGREILDPGWRNYYPYYPAKESDLPELSEGESIKLLGVNMEEDKTKPPPRFSQGKLIQEMERLGLGTKSTRHEIIKKLYNRKYVEGKYLTPTVSARAVIDALGDHNVGIEKPEMTNLLEKDMLEIANGSKSGGQVVEESQDILEEVMETLQSNRKEIGEEIKRALRMQNYIGVCKSCGGDLNVIRSRAGQRFVGCSGFPDCRVTHPLPQAGKVIPTMETCEECGSPMIEITERGGKETICVDAQCPTTRERNLLGTCSKCGGDLTIRYSKRGKRFVGCSGYPKCNNSFPLPQKGYIQPTKETCEKCGSPIITVLMRNRRKWTLCVNPDCETKKFKQA
ncbi:MAG: DNA topoisomerase I [Thermoplasmata archaeon]|nr:DNA topoisomerase I [Thermoplasmata archaeon]